MVRTVREATMESKQLKYVKKSERENRELESRTQLRAAQMARHPNNDVSNL